MKNKYLIPLVIIMHALGICAIFKSTIDDGELLTSRQLIALIFINAISMIIGYFGARSLEKRINQK